MRTAKLNYLFQYKTDSLKNYKTIGGMGKQIKKSDLPQKICAGCGRPFSWRKKWEKIWNEVKYCSDRCRNGPKNSGTIKDK